MKRLALIDAYLSSEIDKPPIPIEVLAGAVSVGSLALCVVAAIRFI